MREYKFLSPSALSKYESNRDLFFLHYLCEPRVKRPPQEPFMAVGSSVDAFIKSAIYEAVHGKDALKGSQFEFEKIFEEQVEPHVRDYALEMGKHIFDQYVKYGAFSELLADILQSPYPPQMEFTVKGEIQGVPILGKPDLRYISKEGVHVICDFKVNGAGSKTGASPQQGFKICHDYGSTSHLKPHKKYVPYDHNGLEINRNYLGEFVDYWCDQLSMYAWVMGEPVGGEDWVIRIEQFACRPVPSIERPRIKCAAHIARSQSAYQHNLMARIHDCWNSIQSGHIFTSMTREESDERCESLTLQAKTPKGLHPELVEFTNEKTRIGLT